MVLVHSTTRSNLFIARINTVSFPVTTLTINVCLFFQYLRFARILPVNQNLSSSLMVLIGKNGTSHINHPLIDISLSLHMLTMHVVLDHFEWLVATNFFLKFFGILYFINLYLTH